MTTAEARIQAKSKRIAPERSGRADKSKAAQKPSSARSSATAAETDCAHDARITKHDRILALLSGSQGATIVEMMQATDWQQHSVRGFLAGTVKKKLGFTLTSSKAEGELRRYRIEKRRGR